MLTLQDVGNQILSNKPQKFYIFCGDEYGIKRRYIDLLSNYYGSKIECDSVAEFIDSTRSKKLFNVHKSLYVVRYDEQFLKSIDVHTESKIESTNINGTLVCIYDGHKHVDKLDKYIPNHVVCIDKIAMKFVYKYLIQEFDTIPEDHIKKIVKETDTYNQAWCSCKSISHLSNSILETVSQNEIESIIPSTKNFTSSTFKLGVASKNFRFLINYIDSVDIKFDNILYDILSTLIELEKCKISKFVQSDFIEYSKRWTLEDIYNMYNHTYHILKLTRKISVDVYSSLIYLFSLMQFQKIPSLEGML